MEGAVEHKLINGGLMRKYQNTPSKMFVQINAACGGKQIQGISADKQKINIELTSPIDQPLQGWIEIIGIPLGNNNFKAYEIICFEQNENQEPFDEESHNEICQVIDLLSENDLYKFKN